MNSNFFGFILNLFIFKIIKIFFIYCIEMASRLSVDMWRRMRAPCVAQCILLYVIFSLIFPVWNYLYVVISS